MKTSTVRVSTSEASLPALRRILSRLKTRPGARAKASRLRNSTVAVGLANVPESTVTSFTAPDHATLGTLTSQVFNNNGWNVTHGPASPDLPAGFDATGYTSIFFDVEMGHDSQCPWGRGASPMPSVALIGSEAPGRIEWAIRRGADAAGVCKGVGDVQRCARCRR